MSLLLHALLFMCGIGSVSFASTALTRWRVVVFAAAFVSGMTWFGLRHTADPSWIGCLASGAAALYVLRSERQFVPFMSAIAGGMLAASLAWTLNLEGLSMIEAAALALLLPAIAMFLARRSGFAPPALIEESLLLVFAMGLVIAALPEILDGWKSALVLNRDGMNGANPGVSAWTIALSGAAVMLGGCYSLWRHRWRR